jgi:hypothetical protein
LEKIVLNSAYASVPWPWEHPLKSVQAALRFSGGERFKQNRYRAVRRIEVQGHGFFIKQFFRFPLTKHIKNFFCFWNRSSESILEWNNIERVRAWGIPTLTQVARGEHFFCGIEWGGFLITEELPTKTRLENFLKEFPKGKSTLKRNIVKTVADYARILHAQNYFHKDLYLGHFFIEQLSSESFRIFLIDLQRLAPHTWLREHFKIKDLASLHFSIPKGSVSRADQLRFIKWYLGEHKLQPAHKKLIQNILKKSRRIETHTLARITRRISQQK